MQFENLPLANVFPRGFRQLLSAYKSSAKAKLYSHKGKNSSSTELNFTVPTVLSVVPDLPSTAGAEPQSAVLE